MRAPIEWAERYRREKFGNGLLCLSGDEIYFFAMNTKRDIVHENDDNAARMPGWFRSFKDSSEAWRKVTDAQIKGIEDQLAILMSPYRKALAAIKWCGLIVAGGVIAEAVHRTWDFITRHIK